MCPGIREPENRPRARRDLVGRRRLAAGAAQSALATVILAAGGSTRLGRPKQLVRLRGRALLDRAVSAALTATQGPVVVVVGADGLRLRSLVARSRAPRVEIVHHAGWREGMSSSLRRGLDAVPHGARAVLFMLADQPHVDARSLERLVAAWRRRPARAAAAAYSGRLGVPAILPRSAFRALRALVGDEGARRVLAAAPGVTRVELPEAAVDVDTAEDLTRLARRPARRFGPAHRSRN